MVRIALVLIGPLVAYIAIGAIRDKLRDRMVRRRELNHHLQMEALGRAVHYEPSDGEAMNTNDED